ncbi:MAG: substrate-binding domain-containing protein [Kiritimatiellae bacterium]|nr:substrate-binding domain-containing protein [Kiritimatiellia bacterium]
MSGEPSRVTVVVALPFAYQDGRDKYDGIMRYLRDTGSDWDLRLVRDVRCAASFRRALDGCVAGVMFGDIGFRDGGSCDSDALRQECLALCVGTGVPLVGMDWHLDEVRRRKPARCSFLNIDSEKIGEMAAEVILANGEYVSYGFVGLHPELAWSRLRGAAFARTLRRAGRRPVRLFRGEPQVDGGDLPTWLKALPKPAAVFAANDCAADIVLKVCARSRLRVPEELSVLGVDDDPVFCVHTRPTLSSIRPDFSEMGYAAAQEMDALMSGRSRGVRRIISGEPTVTHRLSTAPNSSAGMLVRRADEIIAARAHGDLDSDTIADELRISRRLLDLRYRQINGMSVREAIIEARVKRARRLLAYSGHSIGTISKLCGYRTKSYLGRVFLKREGVHMREYRRRHSKDENERS